VTFGKSTLAKLVTRFYDPTSGRVLIDGHDLRDVRIESLGRQLGVVPQEPFLFAGPLRDNIRFAAPGASDDRIRAALRVTGLVGVVERLPDGLDTVVQERGQSLSSGERQLVALARAFLAEPRVLVLDEATSNLDPRSESKIENALDVLLEGRTAILIAHRLSTAMKADRIVVVDEGRIIEVGPTTSLSPPTASTARCTPPGPVRLLTSAEHHRCASQLSPMIRSRLEKPGDHPSSVRARVVSARSSGASGAGGLCVTGISRPVMARATSMIWATLAGVAPML